MSNVNEKLIHWVEKAIAEIKALLEENNIPYEDHEPKYNTEYANDYMHQLTFPWSNGDVVVGTLHCSDDMILQEGTTDEHYPSIETYQFPWDGGDITVFETPEKFVNRLKRYYYNRHGKNENTYKQAFYTETKLWRIVHLSTSENYEGVRDEMYAEECAIVECTEEQVKEMCEKCIPISNEDEHIFNKFVYFEVHPNTDFDPIEWMSKRNDLQLTMPVDVYKQLSSGRIEGYCDDEKCSRFFVVPNWDYKEQLAAYSQFNPIMITNWNYIKGGNDNA